MKDTIVLHHSLTKDSGTVSWPAIRRYHVETNGWRAIGYHYGIELIDDRHEILFGRMPEEDAAAVKEGGMNRRGLHLCFVGNFDLALPPADMWRLGLTLVRSLQIIFKIPTNRVFGHRDFATYKSCPGAQFDLAKFRADLGTSTPD